MKSFKNTLVVVFFLLVVCSYANLSVQSYEESLHNPSLSTPRIQFSNNTQNNINGFIAYYYFTSSEPSPVFENYHLNGGVGSIEHINGVNYRVKLDFSSISMPAGSVFPNNSGISFGLHYESWANWRKDDDYSNNMSQTMANNNAIIVTNSAGKLLAGNYPDFNAETIPQERVMARVYALKEGEGNFAKIRLYIKNEGTEALNKFDFSVEITSEHGQAPVFEPWYIPNTTYTIEKRNDTTWIFNFSTTNIALEYNSIFPSGDGMSFGFRYPNWSVVNTSNDYSLKFLQNSFSLAGQIPLYINGRLVSGNPKIHDISDIKKILIPESEFAPSDFDRTVESLFAEIPEGNKKDFWEHLDSFFKDVPNYDSTQQAVEQIFAKFPGLDTLTFISLWQDIKSTYEQLIRLRMHKKYAVNIIPVASVPISMMTAKSSYYYGTGDDYNYDECNYEFPIIGLNSEELWLLFINPMKSPGVYRATDYASKWAHDYDDSRKIGGTFQNRADGFKHAVWNALLCRETGTQYDDVGDCLKWAKELTDAHETGCADKNELDVPMDLHNNHIGREYYRPRLSVGCQWFTIFGWCINEEIRGPSREDTKEMFFDLADKGYGFNELSQLNTPPWINSIVFYRADGTDKLYCLPGITDTSSCMLLPSLEDKIRKIGLLKKNPDIYCDGEISFYMDLEDSNNNNRIVSGDNNPPGIKLSSAGVRFTYCPVYIGEGGDYEIIPRVPYDYVVLRLSDDCPTGTYPFRRYHDNEDSKNNNSKSGLDFGPNIIGKNSSLEYCFVPSLEDSDLEYPFDENFGVFSNYSSAFIIHSEIRLDDEDSNNDNSWAWYNTPEDIKARIQNIVHGNANTVYHIVSYIVIVFNAIVNFFIG